MQIQNMSRTSTNPYQAKTVCTEHTQNRKCELLLLTHD